jgi:hypothetical protein
MNKNWEKKIEGIIRLVESSVTEIIRHILKRTMFNIIKKIKGRH